MSNRRTNHFEVVGLGEINLISINQKFPEFKPVSKEGKELTAKREGSLTYYWIDDEEKKYNESDVFYLVGDKKVQKIKKSEKIENFEIVDKTEILGNFMSDSYYICDVSDTLRKRWNKEIGEDKAITFIFKKSSRGLKFHRAFVFQFQSVLILVSGLGYVSEGIKEYTLMKKASEKAKKVINDVIEIKASDLEQEIGNLIKI